MASRITCCILNITYVPLVMPDAAVDASIPSKLTTTRPTQLGGGYSGFQVQKFHVCGLNDWHELHLWHELLELSMSVA